MSLFERIQKKILTEISDKEKAAKDALTDISKDKKIIGKITPEVGKDLKKTSPKNTSPLKGKNVKPGETTGTPTPKRGATTITRDTQLDLFTGKEGGYKETKVKTTYKPRTKKPVKNPNPTIPGLIGTTNKSEVASQNKALDAIVKNRKKGGFEDITGEGNVKPPKTRAELITKRKQYGIDSTGNISKKGVERYARNMYRTNLPLSKTQLDKAKQFAVGGKPVLDKSGKRIGTTTGKYGGNLTPLSKKPTSLAKVKAKIDAKNPTYKSPITGGKLPLKDPDLKNMSTFDRKMYQRIKDTTPKGGIPNWMKEFDKEYPDKSKLGNTQKPPEMPKTILKKQKPFPGQEIPGFRKVDTKTKEGEKFFKKQIEGGKRLSTKDLTAPKPPIIEPIVKPKGNLFSRIKTKFDNFGKKVRNALADPVAPEYRSYIRPDGTRVATRNRLSKNIVKRTFQKIPKKGKIGALLATGLLGVTAFNALRPKGKDKGKSGGVVIPPFKAADYKPVTTTLSLTSNPNPQKDKKSPELPVNNNPNVRNLVNRVANYKRSTST